MVFQQLRTQKVLLAADLTPKLCPLSFARCKIQTEAQHAALSATGGGADSEEAKKALDNALKADSGMDESLQEAMAPELLALQR